MAISFSGCRRSAAVSSGTASVHLPALRGRGGEASVEVDERHLVVVGHAADDVPVELLVRAEDRAGLPERPEWCSAPEEGEALVLRAVEGRRPPDRESAGLARGRHR